MATLVRPQRVPESRLASSIPKPFPSRPERESLLRAEHLQNLSTQEAPSHVDINAARYKTQEGPSQMAESLSTQASKASGDALHELMPSIAHVQKTCLMTLNNLLSAPTKWDPIVPDRRHSMPSSHQSSVVPQSGTAQSSSALLTLVSNLRNLDSGQIMVETHQSDNDTDLIHELRTRVEGLSSVVDPIDAHLARILISLIGHFNRLSVIHSTTGIIPDGTVGIDGGSPHEPAELFATLKRQLSDLQVERLSQSVSENAGKPPVLVVETALLWSQIDQELENIVAICKERTEGLPRFQTPDHLPPQYDYADHQFDTPPEYDHVTRISTDINDSKSRGKHFSSSVPGLNEKMRLDLEAVTMAIDRLYMVAPQLHNQRVELKSAKVQQMEQARRAGTSRLPSQTVMDGKPKDNDVRELERLWDLLGKASDRKLTDQSVVLEGGMQTRLEKARLRDIQKRDAFVEQLVQHSNAGRLHGQDAILQPARTKDPDALLTLPEFMREAIPAAVRMADPTTLLTLPEFFNEPVPDDVVQAHRSVRIKSKKRSRSTPPLWLRTSSRAASFLTNASTSNASGFDVSYVAENHESLHHVLVFFTVTGATPGVDIEAEVLPSLLDSGEGERLIIKSGLDTSLPLSLPARISPGKKEVKVQSGHYEIKLITQPAAISPPAAESVSLMDALQLSASNPTSFICASCSLPLVQSAKIGHYRDLPSEHWEELVDAWMCHTDQNLHEHIARHGRGFWPEPGQALVGGSYILFEESSIVRNNLSSADQAKRGEDWRLIRCLCGAVTGRRQERHSPELPGANVYRLLKYAIRPVSPTAEPLKVPLSAFIVEDMIEFVQAHATYRFVIFDEEEERPRFLIWLFKPSIRLAYATPTQYIPKAGSIHAAKVLYKIIGPSTISTDLKDLLSTYPGFPQAEYLFYPIDICRRLAALLKESNTAYPESLRMMTGLEVGWLHRA